MVANLPDSRAMESRIPPSRPPTRAQIRVVAAAESPSDEAMSTNFPCSPLLEIDGLIYFPRLCDKIRMQAEGRLPEDYHANLGSGMDLWTCQFLGVDYAALADQVRGGASDAEALAWARKHGQSRPEHEFAWWNAYMRTRGFRDDLSERLKTRREESGFADRDDIQTFMDYIDADEARS